MGIHPVSFGACTWESYSEALLLRLFHSFNCSSRSKVRAQVVSIKPLLKSYFSPFWGRGQVATSRTCMHMPNHHLLWYHHIGHQYTILGPRGIANGMSCDSITLIHVRWWVKLLFFSPRITAYFTAGILKAASR